MAVMVTDILLLDIFNTLGMPTSTTVSMVFELLGASFAISIIKIQSVTTGLQLNDLINTEKALSVIIGIFLSVAIAFVFGAIVQFISRLIFTFNYKLHLKYNIAIFGGIALSAITYFLLIKGIKDMSFTSLEFKAWIIDKTPVIIASSFVLFSLLSQILHWLGVNIFKLIVLTGTFALAMAFASNDLVNFIGVPLAGLASYTDYLANGNSNFYTYTMESLNQPVSTPILFLIISGIVMIVSLATSKKTKNVIKTEVGLGSQSNEEETFGSSGIAIRLVKLSLSIYSRINQIIPIKLRKWIRNRFIVSDIIIEKGASFDLVRGAVNLTIASMLIALGTSLKLPLSTTYVTFMVAMGSSLADKAWKRTNAVQRITGVIYVIGGWFITAGAAFIGAGTIATIMHFGGSIAIILFAVLAIVLIIRNNITTGAKKTVIK
jgi:phosphate/sulfate permease